MKKKISMSFLLLAIVTLLSLSGLFNSLRSIVFIFRNPSSIINWVLSMVIILTPATLVALLVMNTKRDITAIAHPLLLALGCFWLIVNTLGFASDVLGLRGQGPLFATEIYIWIPSLIKRVTKLIAGYLMVKAASCIKTQKKSRAMVVYTSLCCYINLIPLIMSILGIGEGISFLQSLLPLLLVAGICLLPVTLFDYEHCVMVNGTSLKVVAVVGVIVLIVAVIASAVTSGGSHRGGDGKTTCRNCGRKTDLVVGFGFCGNCYEGFNDWMGSN